jgi:hypothetical protein
VRALGRAARAGALGLLVACGDPPAPLPPAVAPPPASAGARVRYGALGGFLAWPTAAPEAPRAVQLRGGPPESAQAEALARAAAGWRVLAVPAEADPVAAAAYLRGLPGVSEVTCEGPGCP